MVTVWILSVHNLHCPRCGTRLVEKAGRFVVPGRNAAVHVGEVDTLTCRAGHALPDRDQLYAHRDQRGLARTAAVQEVVPPAGAAWRVSGPVGVPLVQA